MSSSTLAEKAEQYFHSLNPIARRIGEDIIATKEAYEGLWNTLGIAEQNQAINETVIQPEVALKYALHKPTKDAYEFYPKLHIQTGMKRVIDETSTVSIATTRTLQTNVGVESVSITCASIRHFTQAHRLGWRDEHSAPFSFMTQSQLNLSVIDKHNESPWVKGMNMYFGDSPRFVSPVKSQGSNPCSSSDSYSSAHQIDSYGSSLFESNPCGDLLMDRVESEHSRNIFAKLINKTALLKIQSNVDDDDDDLENLVRERESDTDKSQSNTLGVLSRTKSSDINESTALLETPSSYSSFQSSQLNQEEEERSIPKTGFEFLVNW